jgi:hypothetical protein
MKDTCEEALEAFYGRIDQRNWRIVAMLTEEAGEVQGAFNKMSSAAAGFRQHTVKGLDDVRDEITQLLAVTFLAGIHFGVAPADLLERARMFAQRKAAYLADPQR